MIIQPCELRQRLRCSVNRHESEPLYRRPGTSRILLPGCGRELDDQPGRHPSTVFHVDAVRFGPLADLGGVQPACSRPACAAGWPPVPPPARRAAWTWRAGACRRAWACPAVRSLSYPVPSSPKRRCPRPRCRPGRRCPGPVSSGPRMLPPPARSGLPARAGPGRADVRPRRCAQPLRARTGRHGRAAGRSPVRSLPVRVVDDLLVPPERGASSQRAGRSREPARSSGTVKPVPPATCDDGLCPCG
jgi:hypothetical protein